MLPSCLVTVLIRCYITVYRWTVVLLALFTTNYRQYNFVFVFFVKPLLFFFTNCEALAKQFGHYFDDESCLLASSFHPQFRLSWLPWFFDEPLEVKNRLKRNMSDILVAAD